MYKIFIFFLSFLFCLSASAEEIPQWSDDCDYLYGMYIAGISREPLPSAPIDVTYLYEGISIEIINGMPYSDSTMLVFLLNGHVQPFYAGDKKYNFLAFNIDGNEHIIQNVRFDDLFLADCATHYLQVVSIGLLDRFPTDANGPICDYVNSVTIPFKTDELPNTSMHIEPSQIALPEAVSKKRCDTYCRLDFLDEIGDEYITYPPFVQKIVGDDCSFPIIATGYCNLMQLLVIYDSMPYINDDLSIPCFSLEYGYAYQYDLTLINIPFGTHQVFAIAYPLYNTAAFYATTPKIQFTVERQ